MALVDGGDAGDRAGLVVQNLVGNVRGNAEGGHAADDCAAKVMKDPISYAADLIQLLLGSGETHERFA